jgi:glucose-1-phosphate cytidylyltransferase
MKVVLFCGGLGMRLREHSERVPKPMVNIGYRPILWHVMKYYAHYGHKDFILCLGWKADVIKQYFLNYNECVSNDFVLSEGGSRIDLLNSDIHDWSITFVDTGVASNIGQRLKAVEPHVRDEEVFLANYTDGLTDAALPELIDCLYRNDAVATLLSVKPSQSFHAVATNEGEEIVAMEPIAEADVWMNGGFFVLRPEIFDYMEEGDELVAQPFRRLIQRRLLSTVKYDGFWGCMDTFKEKQDLDDMYAGGNAPWEIWRHAGTESRVNDTTPNPAVPTTDFSYPEINQPA